MFFVLIFSSLLSFAYASEPIQLSPLFDDIYCENFEDFREKIRTQMKDPKKKSEFFGRYFWRYYTFPNNPNHQKQWAYLVNLRKQLNKVPNIMEADIAACQKIEKQMNKTNAKIDLLMSQFNHQESQENLKPESPKRRCCNLL